MNRRTTRSFIFGLLFVAAPHLSAQTATETSKEAAAEAAPSEVTAAKATEQSASLHDSGALREQFQGLLKNHPPEVGKVLKLDPALFQNESYLATYPTLASFVRQHPEVAHNPGFYLEQVWMPNDWQPESPAVKVWNDLLGAAAFLIVVGVFTWLLRTLIEHRRWSRVSRTQTDVHNKLLDRFTSNEDLLAYIQTPTGRRFLESAPIHVEAEPRALSAPLGRIFWSVQAGVVLAAVGIGLQIVSGRLHPDLAPSILTIGVVSFCAGVGFIVAGAIGYFLSKKLGLLTEAPGHESSSSLARD